MPICLPDPPVLTTSAGLEGWGAQLETQTAQCRWSHEGKTHNVHLWEQKVVKLVLWRFQPTLKGNQVLVQSNNMTMVTYLKNPEETRSLALYSETMEIMMWAEYFLLSLRVFHIRGDLNQKLDWLSRHKVNNSKWCLNKKFLICHSDIWPVFNWPIYKLYKWKEAKILHRQTSDPWEQMPSYTFGCRMYFIHFHHWGIWSR